MHGKDQKKVFIIGDSMIKNITGTGISRENIIKMRPHPGATTIDICDYIKPELRQKLDVVIVHCGTNDIPNNINTVKKIKKLVKEIEENNHENIPQVVISSIIKRYDQDYNEEIQSINDKLQRFCTSKCLSFVDNKNIDKSCLNEGKLHLNRRGSSFLANNFKKFVNALWISEPLSKICPNIHEHPMNSLDGIKSLRIHNHSNITLSYLNINSIRNKLDDLKLILNENVDILCLAETKIDESFPTAQFLLPGYHKTYRLDISDKQGGLLI